MTVDQMWRECRDDDLFHVNYPKLFQDRWKYIRYNRYPRNCGRRDRWSSSANLLRSKAYRSSPKTSLVVHLECGSGDLVIPEDLIVAAKLTTTMRLRVGAGFVGILLLSSPFGCSHQRYTARNGDSARILPPPSGNIHGTNSAPQNQKPSDEVARVTLASLDQPETPQGGNSVPEELPGTPPASGVSNEPGQALSLPDAMALAFELQPRLKVAVESIKQARGRDDIAFAAFLPTISTGYSVGGFDLNVGGAGIPLSGLPNSPAFTFLPIGGALPVGLNLQTGYELAELRLQWLVCDFGRRMGRYNQAGIAIDIAQLQTERVYQTVALDVAAAYYQELRVRSLHRIAVESVRRAEDDLDVAQKLAQGGVIEREKVLRAEVALAQARRAVDVTEEAEAIAVAALNLAIGLNVSTPTTIVETEDIPPFTMNLSDCLQTAVGQRREFEAARQAVQVAQEGTRVARADFAPRVVGEGYFNDLQTSSPNAHANLGLGFIKLEWGLFEGGRRVAEMRVADSRIRESIAQVESIADSIAFQVSQAYRQLVAARKNIDHSRPAVDQTKETYRLVVARSRQGDATPAELTDAEVSVTRAQQDYSNAVYDYLTAIARLEYAMGTTMSPATVGP
ncbi:MAG: outer membrane protein [Planctomycetaceae bacterium]|nr:outer membrane protein [Planctomycetaceae bacterium]